MAHTFANALIVLAVIMSGERSAPAADQTVLGRQIVVRDPRSDDPSRRTVIAVAKETGSNATLVGDPTVGGARLELIANGTASSAQVFPLAQGTAAGGDAFWSATGPSSYRYRDLAGEQGPVRLVRIHRGRNGTFRVIAKLIAGPWPFDIVPPNAGTDGFLTISISGGDRYCVQYGTDGSNVNRGSSLWKAKQTTAEACPSPQPAAGQLLALTYNVAGLPEGISGSHPLTNTPLISPRLNAYDLVLVQESWQTPDPNPLAPLRVYHELLAADALHPYKSISAPQPLGTDPRRPSAILADGLNMFAQLAFDPDLIRTMWAACHATAADCLAEKGFSIARTTLARGVTVDIYDLHMEAGGDPEDEAIREQGVDQLLAALSTYSAGRAVIIAGDFNLHTNDEPDGTTYLRLLTSAGLTDSCVALSCGDTGRIDKFAFRSNNTVTITPLSWSNEDALFQDGAGEDLSDHEPIAVRFDWALTN
jgi:endonuclease/exonuclease/phosphatase family metal-dependent hydrolase